MAYEQTKVIQKRSVSYASCGGLTVPIPCGDDALGIHGEYWAVPVKDNGVFRGYRFSKTEPASSYDSFKVVKVFDKATGDTLWVIGTLEELLALCKDGTEVATTVKVVVPEICLCVDTGEVAATTKFTLPPLGAHTRYGIYLAVDGVLLEDNEKNGDAFIDAEDIKDFLVANRAAVGTWTHTGADVINLSVAADKCVGLVAVPYTP